MSHIGKISMLSDPIIANPHGIGFSSLLTRPDSNAKLAKSLGFKYMSFPLHLSPADISGNEVCANRTAACTYFCINITGRAGLEFSGPIIRAARNARTRFYFDNRVSFMARLVLEITNAIAYAKRHGMTACFRLNATSDIPWERIPVMGYANIFDMFPDVIFYDYTKIPARMLKRTMPANYTLTFSLSENNLESALAVLAAGENVAVVFRDKATVKRAIASGYLGYPVISGDDTDLRFLDPKAHIIALYAKGPKAKADISGFVRDL